MRQLIFELPHRPALDREDFLVAPSNAEAVAWIDRWPDWPAPWLALAGPTGAGKTHLAQVWRARSGAVEIAPGELRERPVRDLLGPATSSLVDDAESVAGDSEAERGLFDLCNLLRERGGHLLLAGRQVPLRWPIELPDLRSRLATAVPAVLGPPDDALMQALLVKLFADRQLRPGQGVIDYLVMRMERSYAAAARLVEAIDRRALQDRREVRLPLAREVLGAVEDGASG